MAFPFGKPQELKHTAGCYLTDGIYTGSTLSSLQVDYYYYWLVVEAEEGSEGLCVFFCGGSVVFLLMPSSEAEVLVL